MRTVLGLAAAAAIGLSPAAMAGQCNYWMGGSFDDFARACSGPAPRAVAPEFSGPVIINPNQVIVIEQGVPVIVETAPRHQHHRVQRVVPGSGFTTGNVGPFTTGNIGPFTTFSNSVPAARSFGR